MSGQARHAALSQTLIERVNGGTYPVGELLPTEQELCTQFGVSRTTVREALRRLTDLGLVARKPGVGTRVLARRPSTRFVHAIKSISDIFQYARRSERPRLVTKAEIAAGEDEVVLLRCRPGQRWLRVETVRALAGGGPPMSHATCFLPLPFADIARRIPTRSDPMYTLIERHHGERVVEVQQAFAAITVEGREQARLLDVDRGSAALEVTRHYFADNDRLLLVTVSVYPADRFNYTMRLRYDSPGHRQGED